MLHILHLITGATACLAAGAQLNVNNWYAGNLTTNQILTNIFNTFGGTILYVVVAVFAVGALLIVASAFKGEWKDTGKQAIINALIGLVIVVCSLVIINSVMYYLYG